MRKLFKKSNVLLILTALLTLILVACGNGGDTEETTSESSPEAPLDDGVLDVAISGTLYPNGYYNEDGELVGYNVEILEELANRLDVEIDFMEVGVDGMLSAVQSGQVDVVGEGLTPTEQQAEEYLLSEPIKYSFTSIVVRETDQSEIYSLADFEGKNAAGGATTTYMDVATYLGAEPVTYNNATNDQYFIDVANGRTDFIPNDYYSQIESVRQMGEDLGVRLGNVFYNPKTSHFMYNQNSTDLQEAIDNALTDMIDDGTMTSISETYYNGEDVSIEIDEVNGISVSDLPVIDPDASEEENQAEIEKSINQSQQLQQGE